MWPALSPFPPLLQAVPGVGRGREAWGILVGSSGPGAAHSLLQTMPPCVTLTVDVTLTTPRYRAHSPKAEPQKRTVVSVGGKWDARARLSHSRQPLRRQAHLGRTPDPCRSRGHNRGGDPCKPHSLCSPPPAPDPAKGSQLGRTSHGPHSTDTLTEQGSPHTKGLFQITFWRLTRVHQLFVLPTTEDTEKILILWDIFTAPKLGKA